MVRMFANGPGDRGLILSRFLPKTQKIVLDVSLLSTQYYTERIMSKRNHPEKRVAPSPQHTSVVSIENGTFGLPMIKVGQLKAYIYLRIFICI